MNAPDHAAHALVERSSLAAELPRLEPNDLALFARIAESGSFSRAAEQLRQPRSTVSRRLAELEHALGERLLVRSTRKLRLTEFGRAMLAHAQHVVEALSAATALAENRRVEPSGRLRVTMTPFVAHILAATMIEQYLADHPLVVLEIDLSSRRVDLLAEDFDLVVRAGPIDEDAALTATLIGELPLGLYASPGYVQRRGAPREPAELVARDGLLIARHDGPTPWLLTRRGDGHEERWTGYAPPRCLATSGEVLLSLAVGGQGIVGMPEVFVQNELARGELVRVLPDWRLPDLEVWAVISGRQLLPVKTRVFLDRLREVFRG